jgi:protein tyrosine/serine phosphatase
MRRILVRLLGVGTVLALIVGPVVYAFHEEKQTRNFRIVREGLLYRSARMTLPGLKRIAHDYGIRSVISLRDADAAERAEEEFCRKEEINFFRLPPKSWDTTWGPAEAEVNVRRFLAILDDPDNYPILIHCFAGIHRTGAYVAIYHMERDHWSNEAAIADLKAGGYDNLDNELDVLGYLQQYRPTWKEPQEEPAPETKPARPRGKRRAGAGRQMSGKDSGADRPTRTP